MWTLPCAQHYSPIIQQVCHCAGAVPVMTDTALILSLISDGIRHAVWMCVCASLYSHRWELQRRGVESGSSPPAFLPAANREPASVFVCASRTRDICCFYVALLRPSSRQPPQGQPMGRELRNNARDWFIRSYTQTQSTYTYTKSMEILNTTLLWKCYL